ncbi:DNA/RNA non-specific endonuclease [Kriegella sp. EG-1]|nr:DNA/RNA non-specific endonuclease [Flavobacteriaceae bacterium EG-1]
MNKNTKNKAIYTILLLLCVIGFWLFENFYTPSTYAANENDGPRTEISNSLLPSSSTGEIVEHQHFTLSYNEPYEQAEWVAYILKKEHLTYDDRKRPYFIEDPEVRTKSADWRNYKGSGYDRGHLCPAGDRRFSKQAYDETFYTSNISPQDRDFNAGIWNRLEQQVRRWAKMYNHIFVVTGGVLNSGLITIGDEDVAVPKYYYKIVARGDINNLKLIAFLMPGKESTKSLQHFTVTVDEVERLTGIDFFEKLPDNLEAMLESSNANNNWKF